MGGVIRAELLVGGAIGSGAVGGRAIGGWGYSAAQSNVGPVLVMEVDSSLTHGVCKSINMVKDND